MSRICIPGIAARPAGFTRHVAWLADAEYTRSRRGVPVARCGNRTACYFGSSDYWALFARYKRVGETPCPITAALWLRGM